MQSLKQFFDFLNSVDFEYVVLRNFEHLPYSVELGHHSDLDLLVYDLPHFLETIPEATPEYPLPRVRYKLPLEENFIYMDVRHIGDGYYPTQFEKNILATREMNSKGFYTPNYIHHQIALAYHAVHHKGSIAPDYRRWLGDASEKQLLDALKNSPVGWVQPNDPTVGKFNRYWKGATSAVEKIAGQFHKKQLGFLDYDLINNESKMLLEMASPGRESNPFPGHCGLTNEGVLILTDCGEPLTAENLPADWRDQMMNILKLLKSANVMHRDIRPDNFTVKDGRIYLIDFGWSCKEGVTDDLIANNPPSVLGYPFKSSEGFDDVYSMRAVIRHFDFLIEEKEGERHEEIAKHD